MSEFDSPNYTEYTYEKRAYGKNLIGRVLLVCLYISFVAVFFLVCYITRLIPLFALSVVFTWILVFFTWRYVSYDCFYTFDAGILTLGVIRGTKRGRVKREKLKIHVKEALYAAPLYLSEKKLQNISKIYDLSSTKSSDKRILIIFNKDNRTCAAIFEGTAHIAKLLYSFCPHTEGLKSSVFN